MNHFTRRAWIGTGFLLLCLATQALAVAIDRFPLRHAFLYLIPVATVLIAAAFCGLAAAQAKHRFVRWYWLLFSFALVSTAAAEGTWAVYDLAAGTPLPYPSLADVLWLPFYPLVLAALLFLTGAREGRRTAEAISILDALLFALFGTGLCWEFMMLPVMNPDTGALASLTSLILPIGDLLLLGAVVSIAATNSRRGVPAGTLWVIASLAVTCVADIAFTRMSVAGTYATGRWVDPLWSLSYTLLALGAIVYVYARAGGRTVEREIRPLVTQAGAGVAHVLHRYSPYAAVLMAGGLSYSHFVAGGSYDPVSDIVAVVITGLIPLVVVSRQFLLSAENQRLQASLLQVSAELEDRVAERTRRLAEEMERLDVLNQASREFSACTSVGEALIVGAGLLARAKDCVLVAVSAPGPRGELQFSATADTSRAEQRVLQRTLRKFLLSNAANSDSTPVVLRNPASTVTRSRAPADPASVPFAAMMVLPIISHQVMLGAACMASHDPSCSLSHAEMGLAENIISQLGVTLENACRYDDARFLADSDALTGLPNRRTITERLDQEVARHGRSGSTFAVIMMDVDNFKLFNDRYGHATGDQVLVVTARALSQALRAGDMVGRFGGDEFVAVLPDTDFTGAGLVVGRIGKCLAAQHFQVEHGTELLLRVSCGIAMFPYDGCETKSLLDIADAQMYRAKRQTITGVVSTPA